MAELDDNVDDYYDANGFGYGTTKDGILLMVCMEERDYATCTTGAAQDWFDDGTLYDIENAFVPLLSAGKYFEAFSTYASRCERVLQGVDRREVLYLDDAIFDEPMTVEESAEEMKRLKEREAQGLEDVPPGAKKANKHSDTIRLRSSSTAPRACAIA